MVEIEIFGQLAPGVPRKQILTLEHSMIVLEIANILALDLDDIGLISINGVQSELDEPVPPGCRLCFFPPMSGG
jgi:molybdopterin converting factor small subunit